MAHDVWRRLRIVSVVLAAVLSAETIFAAPIAAALPSPAPVAQPSPSGQPDPTSSATPAPSQAPSPTAAAETLASATTAPTATPAATTAPTPAPTNAPTATGPSGLTAGATEITTARTEYSQTYDNHDGTRTTLFFADPVFFRPVGSTTYQPIDVGFVAAGPKGTGLISADAPVAVSVNASSSEGDFLTTASGDYTVGFALAPASAEVVPSVPHATGAVADFPSLMPGIDLRVIAGANGAKSFFIWRVAPADPTIRYVVDAPGLTLVPEADGSIALRDATGTTVATIPHPYAVDSTPDAFVGGGRYTSDVTLALEPDGRTITVSVDPGWLKGAVFPVYVDPSTGWVSNTGMDSYGDAHVASGYPNDHFADYVRPDSPYSHELWNGTDPSGTSGESYDYLKWDLSAYANVTVDAANLRLYPYHQYYNAPTSETTYARRVIGTWKETTVTWATKPPGDMPVTAACVEGVWCIWDVTAIVQTWLAGSGSATNSGFRLDTSGKGSTYWKRFIASEEGGSTRPALAITYHTAVVATATPALTGAISWTYTDSSGAAQTTYHVDVAATQAGLGSANLATSGDVAGTASA